MKNSNYTQTLILVCAPQWLTIALLYTDWYLVSCNMVLKQYFMRVNWRHSWQCCKDWDNLELCNHYPMVCFLWCICNVRHHTFLCRQRCGYIWRLPFHNISAKALDVNSILRASIVSSCTVRVWWGHHVHSFVNHHDWLHGMWHIIYTTTWWT